MSECGSCKLSLACPFIGWTNGQVAEATKGESKFLSKYEDRIIVARTCRDCGAMYLVLQKASDKAESFLDESVWLSWQQIHMMFDCAIFAMQRNRNRLQTEACPRCKRWSEPSAYERRQREHREQEEKEKEKSEISQ